MYKSLAGLDYSPSPSDLQRKCICCIIFYQIQEAMSTEVNDIARAYIEFQIQPYKE